MNHLKYCLKEILIIKALLEINNSDFYKRSISRYISLRVDDFIKLAFSLNKTTLNQQLIKDELNTLQELYREFFKRQRDKFGAHFQELDFANRLDLWSQIDFEKTDFFTSIPLDIYHRFDSLEGYKLFSELFDGISNEYKSKIEKTNSELDIEKYPNFSSDILSLTRYNTGGLIPCSKLQIKAGVLKSLEIIIDYSFQMYKLTEGISELSEIFKKLIIIDIVSYCDNFITRTDLTSGALQEEDGLDNYLIENELPIAFSIMKSFKDNTNFQEYLDSIRNVRNITCGHIDRNLTICDLQNELNSIDLEKTESFYQQIRNTYKQICREETVFRTYLLESKDRIYGIQRLIGLQIQPFEKNVIPETVFESPNVNDESEYNKYFKLLLDQEKHDEARHYFCESFSSSEVLEEINFRRDFDGCQRNEIIDYRKVHDYFKSMLLNEGIPPNIKIQVIQLFIECKSGHPNILLYILLDTYGNNRVFRTLNIQYLEAFGELCSERDNNIFSLLQNNFLNPDFYISYHSLLSIFKIDIKSRQNLTVHINTKESVYSKYIKEQIFKTNDTFLKINYSIAFASELYFSTSLNIYHKKLENFYITFFNDIFKTTIIKYLTPLSKNDVDKRKINKIIHAFNTYRFSTLVGMLSDFLDKKKHNKMSERFRTLLYEGIIKFSLNDISELHNFSVVNFKIGDLMRAIQVAERMVANNPTNSSNYYLLLSLYLNDKMYESEFNKTKKYIVDNFKLSEKSANAFELLKYE